MAMNDHTYYARYDINKGALHASISSQNKIGTICNDILDSYLSIEDTNGPIPSCGGFYYKFAEDTTVPFNAGLRKNIYVFTNGWKDGVLWKSGGKDMYGKAMHVDVTKKVQYVTIEKPVQINKDTVWEFTGPRVKIYNGADLNIGENKCRDQFEAMIVAPEKAKDMLDSKGLKEAGAYDCCVSVLRNVDRVLSVNQPNVTNLETELTELKSTIGQFSNEIDNLMTSLDELHLPLPEVNPVENHLDI